MEEVVEKMIARLPSTDILTTVDVAMAIGARSTSPVVRMIEAGVLPAVRFSKNGRYYILRDDVVRMIQESRV